MLIWSIGGEAGERVPVARVRRDAAAAYSYDRNARAKEALAPFRRLCGGRAYANVSARGCATRDVQHLRTRIRSDFSFLGAESRRWRR